MSTDVDERRLPHELHRALEAAGFLSVEAGSVRLQLDGTDVVVMVVGKAAPCVVARIPGYRLRAVAPERLAAMFEAGLDEYPPDEAAALRAARAERGMQVEDLPDVDVVTLGVDGVPVVSAHRRLLVDGWA